MEKKEAAAIIMLGENLIGVQAKWKSSGERHR